MEHTDSPCEPSLHARTVCSVSLSFMVADHARSDAAGAVVHGVGSSVASTLSVDSITESYLYGLEWLFAWQTVWLEVDVHVWRAAACGRVGGGGGGGGGRV